MNTFVKMLVSASILTLVVGIAPAQTKKMAAEKCPVCHMALAAKKSKANPVAVKLKGGKVMYCCAGCKMKH